MSIFSTNYDWDRKDDPLSNLINEDTSSVRSRSSNLSDSKSRLNATYSEGRSSSTFLDNFLNEEQTSIVGSAGETRKTVKFDESTIQTPSSRKSTNIDWLGLGSEPEETNGKEDDWLTSGLSRRQKKTTQSNSAAVSTGKTDEYHSDNLKSGSEKSNQPLDKVEFVDRSITANNDADLTVLRTKVSILEIEKIHLTESIDKLNANHEQEINLLKQLHEQQINLTKNLLSEQENLMKEERDRRIGDLQNQLNTMERYLSENRLKSNERVTELEKEWLAEVKRLKTIHETAVNRLIEQHEQDLDRLNRIKEREIETLQNFQTKFGNLDDLLMKWQGNSEKMETLHQKLIIEQDSLLNRRLNDIDMKDRQIENIEKKWSQLSNNLEFERANSDQLKNLFIKMVEDEKQSIEREREQLRNDRNEFESERKKFYGERRTIELELEKSRDQINQTQTDQRKQDEQLKLKANELNEQQIHLLNRQNEWKMSYERENDRLDGLAKQLTRDQLKLTNDLNELKRTQDLLASEQKLFEQKKELFDKEKVKLEKLACSIAKRGEELEELSETVNEDRKENERLIKESESLKQEFDEKLKVLEHNLVDLKRRELHLQRQSEIVHHEWQELQDEKMNVLCSLCGNSLNQGRPNLQKVDQFLSAVHSSDLYLNINDNDRSLLIWQITGQEENAMLEEETEFLRSLKK